MRTERWTDSRSRAGRACSRGGAHGRFGAAWSGGASQKDAATRAQARKRMRDTGLSPVNSQASMAATEPSLESEPRGDRTHDPRLERRFRSPRAPLNGRAPPLPPRRLWNSPTRTGRVCYTLRRRRCSLHLCKFIAAIDPSGVFGRFVSLRKKGLPGGEYIPIRMAANEAGAPGDYTLDVPAALVSVDALEYYIEAWDNAGNGPARVGSPESPLPVKVEEEKKIIVGLPTPPAPPNVILAQRGGAPTIPPTPAAQAAKGPPIQTTPNLPRAT